VQAANARQQARPGVRRRERARPNGAAGAGAAHDARGGRPRPHRQSSIERVVATADMVEVVGATDSEGRRQPAGAVLLRGAHAVVLSRPSKLYYCFGCGAVIIIGFVMKAWTSRAVSTSPNKYGIAFE
jgi:hypothetical protein